MPFVNLYKFNMTGRLNQPPYEPVYWSVFNVPDITGRFSGYFGSLVDIYVVSITDINTGREIHQPQGPAGGDLGGSYPNPMVIGIDGYAVPIPTGTNTVLTYNAGALSWLPGGGGSDVTFAGDLVGTDSSQTVTGLLNQSLPNINHSTGFLQWNGSNWVLSVPGGGGSDVTFAGDLVGTDSSQTVTGLLNQSLPNINHSTGFLQWNGSNWVLSVPGGGFSAGGDLTGSSSSQQVAQISGATGNINFAASATSPTISQSQQTADSATQQLLIIGQQAYGTASTHTSGSPVKIEGGPSKNGLLGANLTLNGGNTTAGSSPANLYADTFVQHSVSGTETFIFDNINDTFYPYASGCTLGQSSNAWNDGYFYNHHVSNNAYIANLTVTGLGSNAVLLGGGAFLAPNSTHDVEIFTSYSGNLGFSTAGDLAVSSGVIQVSGLLGSALPTTGTGYLEWTGSAWAYGSGGGGGGGLPSGTGLVVVNSGVGSAKTMSGDATFAPSTGVLTIGQISGSSGQTNVASHLVPITSVTYNLGGLGYSWNNLYVYNVLSQYVSPATNNVGTIGTLTAYWADGYFSNLHVSGTLTLNTVAASTVSATTVSATTVSATTVSATSSVGAPTVDVGATYPVVLTMDTSGHLLASNDPHWGGGGVAKQQLTPTVYSGSSYNGQKLVSLTDMGYVETTSGAPAVIYEYSFTGPTYTNTAFGGTVSVVGRDSSTPNAAYAQYSFYGYVSLYNNVTIYQQTIVDQNVTLTFSATGNAFTVSVNSGYASDAVFWQAKIDWQIC